MSLRRLTGVFSLFASAALLCAASAGDNSTEISLQSPVQIPETTLQPGKYTFALEDRLPDRAIVRITDSSGAQHFLLTVPTSKLPKSTGLIYFTASSGNKALHGWECPNCAKALEFVYPKDEAVKLTGETGQAVLAFDPTYDKLPDNLTADDRKVVTLWLLSPKRVTSAGTGEGLVAAKYSSAPSLSATNSEEPPHRMPKTAGNIYLELAVGFALFSGGSILHLMRKGRSNGGARC